MGVSLTLLRTPCTLASHLLVNIPHRWTLNIIKELMEHKPVHTIRAIAIMGELPEHHRIFNNNLTPGLNNQGVRCLQTLTMVAMDRLGIKLKHSSSRRQVYKWQHQVVVQQQMVQVSILPTLFQPLQIIQNILSPETNNNVITIDSSSSVSAVDTSEKGGSGGGVSKWGKPLTS